MMMFLNLSTLCCTTCNRSLQSAIADEALLLKLSGLLVIFALLAIGVWAGVRIYARNHNRTAQPGHFANPVPLLRTALVLGIGIGGFIDGIVFHQLLQWHQMLSNQLPPDTVLNKSVNMFWDGVFHAGMLVTVGLGVGMLWKLLKRESIDSAGKVLWSGSLMGWGLFNIVEGIIDHHILKLHNVREVTHHPDAWNFGFLGFSVVLIVLGIMLLKSHRSVPAVETQAQINDR